MIPRWRAYAPFVCALLFVLFAQPMGIAAMLGTVFAFDIAAQLFEFGCHLWHERSERKRSYE